MPRRTLDAIDRKILALLQQDGRISPRRPGGRGRPVAVALPAPRPA